MKKLKVGAIMFLSFLMFMPKAMAATNPQFCVRTSAIWQFAGYGLFALKILVPLIIIAFGIIDFSKAVMSGDDKGIKSAAASLFRRLVVGIAIFFVPTIIHVVFGLIDDVTGNLDEVESCETCLLSPTSAACDAFIDEAEELRSENN